MTEETDIQESSMEPVNDETALVPDAATSANTNTNLESGSNRKRKGPAPGQKVSAEVLQRRKEGRIKAAATIANKIKKSGIARVDNNLQFSNVKSINLINQKNYYTDYLKKDDQITFLRNLKNDRLNAQKLKKAKENEKLKLKESTNNAAPNSNRIDFEKFDLNDIKMEMDNKIDDDEDEDDEDDEDEDTIQEKEKLGSKTLVIHPGSSNIHIGLATDAYPKTIPTLIAIPNPNHNANYHAEENKIYPPRVIKDDMVFFNEEFNESKKLIQKDFKERMRYYKRRILPNSSETVYNFNKKQKPEKIPEHNDPMRKDWIEPNSLKQKKYLVGKEALNLPNDTNWILRNPIINGKFNEFNASYKVREEIIGDIQIILTESLATEFGINYKNFKNYNIILIIADLYDKTYIETWISLLLKMNFDKVAILQESLSATFGAGVSSACVIDIGAQTTKISCVDEGMVINDSRIKLDYGGDDITKTFMKLLLQSAFPYQEINLNKKYDWELSEQLKKNFVTFQDQDIAIQLYNFYKRIPNEQTEKFDFKVFDEVMLSAMGLFYPDVFQVESENNTDLKPLFPNSIDQYTGKPNNPYSKSEENLLNDIQICQMTDEEIIYQFLNQHIASNSNPYSKPKPTQTTTTIINNRKNLAPLDFAIIESISNSCKSDLSKFKKMYENLLIVGGGSKIPGFEFILTDRINIWRPHILSSSNFADIISYVSKEFENLQIEKENYLKTNPNATEEELEERFKLVIDFDKINEISDKNSLLSVEVLPPPREIDPQVLVWKGGSVFARLKIVNELWINYHDWDLLGNRCLHYKSLFNY